MKKSNKNGQQRYKKTLELVRIARNHLHQSMSQSEIAELCGVSQPTVSKWETGDALATIDNIKPLREKFGDLLTRVSRHYWSPRELEHGTGETTYDVRADPDQKEVVTHQITVVRSIGKQSPPSAFSRYHYRVEGHVILSSSCDGPVPSHLRNHDASDRVPVKKVVIHHQGGGLFRIVELCRLFETIEPDSGECYVLGVPMHRRPWVVDKIHKPLSADELLNRVDDYSKQWIIDGIAAYDLPMSVRKALFDNGFPVSDIVIYPVQ